MLSTTREDLQRTIARQRSTFAATGDVDAAVQLADALLRQMRVTGNSGLANEAERALRAIRARDPEHHGVCRMLAAVLASQHRFVEARTHADRCRARQPRDGWLLGVIADASIELGDYDAGWDAIDAMMTLRPNAAAYARASYARELQGDLTGALELMRMALVATPPVDAESAAWHHVQIGHLLLESGRVDDAARAFAHARHAFPGYPPAIVGAARALIAAGDARGALAVLAPHVTASPTPDGLALIGDLHQSLRDGDAAERAYLLAEAAWMTDAPEPSRLARFLAERGRRVEHALDLARRERAQRRDIFTEDAYAWALFQTGRIDDAHAAIARALRTGSRDRRIRYHAAAIAAVRGDDADARRYLGEALSGAPRFDLIAAPAAQALRHSLNAAGAR
jgi:predicted Zn-dependent protease